MKLYKERILSDSQLKRLGEHKYSCTSASILDKLLQPYWNWLTSKVPLWLAPNLLTIIGLFINILTALILLWYSPDAKVEAPRWACGLCAIGLFIYQSLDAIDGKQARRTGSVSPLGELFDHGCDSMSTVFVALSACTAIQMGYYPGWMFFQCFCAMTLFYCAHWQTYVSGTLRFGKIDVTEAQYTIIGILLISAIFGPSVWSLEFFSDTVYLWHLIPLSTLCVGLWTLYQSLVVIFTGGVGKNGSTVAVPGFSFTWNLVMNYCIILGDMRLFRAFLQGMNEGGCGKNGSTVAIPVGFTEVQLKMFPIIVACAVAFLLAQANISVIFTGGVGKNGSTVAGTSVLSPIIPFSMVLVPAFIIYQKSPEHVYEEHPALYLLAFGLVAAKVTNRLVVAHMTKSEMDYMDWSLMGPTMLFLNQYFNTFIKEYYVLWMCLIWVTIDLLRYCFQVCTEICDYLHIELFRIPCQGDAPRIAIPTLHHASEKNGPEKKMVYFEDRVPLLDEEI